MSKNITKRITGFNEGRNPEFLKLKYRALKESPFKFFRGTCHLFYEDLPKKSIALQSPAAWLCGDLHLENFGSYKGDNRLTYFDMNDFDESLLAPCLLDLLRLSTSIFLIRDTLKVSNKQLRSLVSMLLRSYSDYLCAGYIRSIERDTAKGIVRKFLNHIELLKRSELLKRTIKISKKKPTLRIDKLKTFTCTEKDRTKVKAAIKKWAAKNTSKPDFFKVHDVALLATGTGSLGIERYMVLIEGNGGPDGYYLLDIKEISPAAALRSLKLKQPPHKNEAERLIHIQKQVQAVFPAFLSYIELNGKHFLVKEHQPAQHKIDILSLKGDREKFGQLLHDMGRIIAWNNLRSGGRQGSAHADELMKFGHEMGKMEKDIINYAEAYAAKTVEYWKEFSGKVASS